MGKYPSCDSCEAYKDKFCVDLKTGVRKFEPDPRLGCPGHKPVKLFRMHDHPDESRKSFGLNILDNNGIELDEKNPGPMGDWESSGVFCKGENEVTTRKCIDCAHMSQANAPYVWQTPIGFHVHTTDYCQKFKVERSRHAVCVCTEHTPVEKAKKPIPTEMFTVTKTGDANTSEHYKHFRIQPIDFMVANDLGFLEANVIKYICRYPYKENSLKDLEKARQYVDWLIERERKRGWNDVH